MESAVRVAIFGAGRRARGRVPRRDTRMCWATLSRSHHRLKMLTSSGMGRWEKVGGGLGIRSGRERSRGSEGSKICPRRLLARKSIVTPSSQAKKSVFKLRRGMWVTVGKVFETVVEEEEWQWPWQEGWVKGGWDKGGWDKEGETD